LKKKNCKLLSSFDFIHIPAYLGLRFDVAGDGLRLKKTLDRPSSVKKHPGKLLGPFHESAQSKPSEFAAAMQSCSEVIEVNSDSQT
jgi:hypothetical protein